MHASSRPLRLLRVFFPTSRDPSQRSNISPSKVKNEVVIWDRIVRRKEDAVVNVVGKNKYMFRELSSTFK